MLTNKCLDLIEFNNVIYLFQKLNMQICVDIIDRVSQYQEVTITTKYQLETLKQTGGLEVFNQAIKSCTSLTAETKKELENLYNEVASLDLETYKSLYKYRDKEFKISDTQYAILKGDLERTANILKNLTNTIAFASQQAYVNAVDNAYFKAISGAFTYNEAILSASKDVAKRGITLSDSAGRNVQIETAVRRNVMSAMRTAMNEYEKSIADYLECDGYEVAAHIGARPTHALAQGKQYAITQEKANQYHVPLWSSVSDLWEEYNCRHSYFGIILGISEPQYSNKELQSFKNAKVTLNGKSIDYYTATQKQRALESRIRNQKREILVLKKAGIDTTVESIALTNLNAKYKNLCDETGLKQEYARLKIPQI